jgi:ribosomal protein S18 acetylase RimI-like enzyme
MEIKQASELDDAIREEISTIFVEGFGKELWILSKDHNTLIKAFAHTFVLDIFYVAIINSKIAGIMACTNMETHCTKFDEKIFKKYFGFIKGIIANNIFKNYFQKLPKYPIETNERMASVEFVATSEKYRGKGVASAIMNYLYTFPQYDEYILEVADTNTAAIKLYDKLGYKEVYRIKQKFSKYIGINYLVYMKYSKKCCINKN